MGALGADGRVLAVAGVHPGVVRELAEQPGLDVVDQLAKRAASCWVVPTPPGKTGTAVNSSGGSPD
jgi:hypothetical protein